MKIHQKRLIRRLGKENKRKFIENCRYQVQGRVKLIQYRQINAILSHVFSWCLTSEGDRYWRGIYIIYITKAHEYRGKKEIKKIWF